jgi:hypothetical protein
VPSAEIAEGFFQPPQAMLHDSRSIPVNHRKALGKAVELIGVPSQDATIAERKCTCGVRFLIRTTHLVNRRTGAIHTQDHFIARISQLSDLYISGSDYVQIPNGIVFSENRLPCREELQYGFAG